MSQHAPVTPGSPGSPASPLTIDQHPRRRADPQPNLGSGVVESDLENLLDLLGVSRIANRSRHGSVPWRMRTPGENPPLEHPPQVILFCPETPAANSCRGVLGPRWHRRGDVRIGPVMGRDAWRRLRAPDSRRRVYPHYARDRRKSLAGGENFPPASGPGRRTGGGRGRRAGMSGQRTPAGATATRPSWTL